MPSQFGLTSSPAKANNWRDKFERIHVLSIELFSAKRQALEEVFHQVRIIILTVGGFDQLPSGEASSSRFIESFVFPLCVVDESHQLDFALARPVAAKVKHMLLLWDKA